MDTKLIGLDKVNSVFNRGKIWSKKQQIVAYIATGYFCVASVILFVLSIILTGNMFFDIERAALRGCLLGAIVFLVVSGLMIWLCVRDRVLRRIAKTVLEDSIVVKATVQKDLRAYQVKALFVLRYEINGQKTERLARRKFFLGEYYMGRFSNGATVRVAYSPKYDEILLLKD